MLVILAEFWDRRAIIEPARFEDLLFGPGPSVRDYYLEVSGGRFQLTGDVHGWVTLSGRQIDYSAGVRGTGPYPQNAQKMTEEAVQAAIDGGLDLDGYDADGNDVVDALLIIHAGQGWEWASSTCSSRPDLQSINSHKWVTVKQEFVAGKPDVIDYFTCPELMLVQPSCAPAWDDSIATIGVYCHEFGHVLGLPDFYDVGTFENYIGVWDLMDYGSWNRIGPDPVYSAPGAIPAHLSAWSKMFLGWTTPIEITAGVGEEIERFETLTSASQGGPPAQILANALGVDWSHGNPGRGEFFLAEVRSQDGYDAGLPAEGLLIYHVDESRATNSEATNPDGRRILRLLAQDGSAALRPLQPIEAQSAGDPWPNAQSTFGPSSTPSSVLYDESPSGVTLTNIDMDSVSTSVSFEAIVTNLRSEVALPFARPNPWQPSVHGETRIVLSLEASGVESAEVVVFDVRGRRIRVLETTEELTAENRIARWDGRNDRGDPVPAGVYFLLARTTSGSAAVGKVTLVR
jgi:M6 family metalloprotease-like protein